jgi:hypothetical protein
VLGFPPTSDLGDVHHPAAGRYTTGNYDYSVAWLLQLFLGLFGWIYDFITLNEQVDERNRAVV